METAILIIVLALLQYVYFTIRVGLGRGKFGVDAPATTGNETWERLFRVQQNTLEQLVIFIPATFAYGLLIDNNWIWLAGLFFVAGRFLYAHEYVSAPSSRVPGMAMTLTANAGLLLCVLVAVLNRLF